MVSEHDVRDVHRVAELLATTLPSVQFVIVPGVGHMLNLAAHERFARELLAFLRTEAHEMRRDALRRGEALKR